MQALESLALEFVGYIPTWRYKNRLILSEIANRLNSQGVPSKADKGWTSGSDVAGYSSQSEP